MRRTPPKVVSLEEIKRRLDAREPYTLLDVREEDEHRAGFIPGAISIPRDSLAPLAPALLPDKHARIVAYCSVGARSAFAAERLAELGYTNVETASPGFVRWRELGYPVDAPRKAAETTGTAALTDAQRERYARHLLLAEVGERGQARLLRSKVLVVGAGGLGSAASLYLAAAGVGTLGLVDADVVEASNLQRQILHATSRVGQPKVVSGATALGDLNPDVTVVGHDERLTAKNVERIFADYDVVVDGADNFPTRYLVNDASVFLGKPVVHGSISRFHGQLTTFVPARAPAKLGSGGGAPSRPAGPGGGPCYRCLYPEPPPPHLAPSCQEAGVLGVLPGVIGALQATEALKLLLGEGDALVGRLLTYDALEMKFREIALGRAPDCPVCGQEPSITDYVDYEGFCARG